MDDSIYEPIPQDPDDKYPLPYDRAGKIAALVILVLFVSFLAWHVVAAVSSGTFSGNAPVPPGHCYEFPDDC